MARFPTACVLAATVAIAIGAAAAQDAAPPAAAEPAVVAGPVTLELAELERPGAVLSKSALAGGFDKIIFYKGLILCAPERIELTPQKASAPITLGATQCAIGYDRATRKFSLTAGGKTAELKPKRYGLAGQVIEAGAAKGRYCLAFPRSFTYMDNAVVFYAAGAVRKGKVGPQTLCLFDDNTDAAYDAAADTMCLGEPGQAGLFVPISPFVTVGPAVAKLAAISPDGAKLTVETYDGPTGKLVVKTANGPALQAAFVSDDAKLNFTVSSPGGRDAKDEELVVIPGKYRLAYGFVTSPEGQIIALIAPGKAEQVAVAKDGSADATLGAAAVECKAATSKIEKKPSREAEKAIAFTQVSIPADSLAFRGQLGEEYQLSGKVTTISVELYAGDKRVYSNSRVSLGSDGAFTFVAEAQPDRRGPLVPLTGKHALVVRFSTAGFAAAGKFDVDL